MNKQEKTSFFNTKLEDMPIGIVGTMLGAISLSNIYTNVGLNHVQAILTNIGAVVVILALLKFILYPKKVFSEMNNTIIMSIYPTFTMLTMSIGAYYVKFNYTLGKTIWTIGLIINLIFIVFFLIKHIFLGFKIENALPSWFVLLVGISVSCVTSKSMNEPFIVKYIFFFVVISFLTYLPVVIYRLCTVPVPDTHYHTIAIFAAPGSLCTVSYITLYENANIYITLFFFTLAFIATLYDYINFPRFFSLKFTPMYAALTFPLAISCVASFKVSAYLEKLGYSTGSLIVKGIGEVELFITTAVIAFVMFKFLLFFFNIPIRKFTK